MPDLLSQITALWREVVTLRRRMERRAIIQQGGASMPYLVLTIDKGNTLETGQHGIKWAADVSSVPSAYDPDVTSSFVDGIGRATLHKNGVAQAGYVLVVNDSRGTFGNALLQGDQIFTQGKVAIPVSGGGTVSAYVAG